MANIDNYLDDHNRIDVNELRTVAEEAEAQKDAEQAEAFRDYLNTFGQTDEALADIQRKTAEATTRDNEAEAQRRIQEEQDESNREIEERIRQETGTTQESDVDQAYKNLLNALRPK